MSRYPFYNQSSGNILTLLAILIMGAGILMIGASYVSDSFVKTYFETPISPSPEDSTIVPESDQPITNPLPTTTNSNGTFSPGLGSSITLREPWQMELSYPDGWHIQNRISSTTKDGKTVESIKLHIHPYNKGNETDSAIVFAKETAFSATQIENTVRSEAGTNRNETHGYVCYTTTSTKETCFITMPDYILVAYLNQASSYTETFHSILSSIVQL